MDADQVTVHEITGYRNAMAYVQQLGGDPDFQLDESLIRSLHFMMLGHDLTKSPGSYRKGRIYVHDDEADETVYEGPEPELLSALMKAFVSEVQEQLAAPGTGESYVVAAMAHLNLAMIHPFRDGNGRMARCLQTMILTRNQLLGQEFCSIEEWLGRNTQGYYGVLAKTGMGRWNPSNDTHDWVRFNLRAHHMQAQTVWHRVLVSNELWGALAEMAESRGFKERAINALFPASQGLRVRRPGYQEDAEVEEVTANKDLKGMLDAGLLTARGQTRGRFYTGSAELRKVYGKISGAHKQQLTDPYVLPADKLGSLINF